MILFIFKDYPFFNATIIDVIVGIGYKLLD